MSYGYARSHFVTLAAASALVLASMLAAAPASAHSADDDGAICHDHERFGVPHCHFETAVGDIEAEAQSPLRETGVRSALLIRKVLGVEFESILAEEDARNAVDEVCRRDGDCGDGQRCIDGECRRPRLRPAKLLLDGLTMSFRIGGPGAVMQVRW